MFVQKSNLSHDPIILIIPYVGSTLRSRDVSSIYGGRANGAGAVHGFVLLNVQFVFRKQTFIHFKRGNIWSCKICP